MSRSTPTARLLAILALAGWLAVGWAYCTAGQGRVPAPFAWLDVAAVCLACAGPLAWVIAAPLGRASPTVAAVLAVAALATDFLLLTTALPGGPAWRAFVGLALALPPALSLASWVGKAAWGADWLAATVAAALAFVPASYVAARCQHEDARLGELLAQSRFAEAQVLAGSLLALDPARQWEGRTLSEVAWRLDRRVAELESGVSAPLPEGVPARERIDRARRLAMLDRTAEALGVLRGAGDPESLALRATILETRQEWDGALEEYQRAEAAWRSRADPARADGLAQAAAGIAYCQRKLGRYADAEEAYLRMLSLAPTADSHFLLARFYEDTQQAGKAHAHARRAMELAPSRYRQPGEKLIEKLTARHFGCLGVFREESRPARGSE